MVIGGSDEYCALKTCELYYPQTNTLHAFPYLNIARENASVCIMDNLESRGYVYIYVLGGFDKKSIDQIERIKISFENGFDFPIV